MKAQPPPVDIGRLRRRVESLQMQDDPMIRRFLLRVGKGYRPEADEITLVETKLTGRETDILTGRFEQFPYATGLTTEQLEAGTIPFGHALAGFQGPILGRLNLDWTTLLLGILGDGLKGMGKTQAAYALIHHAHAASIIAGIFLKIVVFCAKGDFLHLAAHPALADVILREDLRVSLFTPPPGVDADAFRPFAARLFCQASQLAVGSETTLASWIAEAAQNAPGGNPTLREVIAVGAAKKYSYGDRHKQWQSSILGRAEGLLAAAPDVFETREDLLFHPALDRPVTVLDLSALGDAYAGQVIAQFACGKRHLQLKHRNLRNHRELHVELCDEALWLFGRRMLEFAESAGTVPVMASALLQGRELGHAFWILSQRVADLSPVVLQSGLRIHFRSDEQNLLHLERLYHLNQSQRDGMFRLEPGMCLAFLNRLNSPEPMLCRVDHVESIYPKKYSRDEVFRMTRARNNQLLAALKPANASPSPGTGASAAPSAQPPGGTQSAAGPAHAPFFAPHAQALLDLIEKQARTLDFKPITVLYVQLQVPPRQGDALADELVQRKMAYRENFKLTPGAGRPSVVLLPDWARHCNPSMKHSFYRDKAFDRLTSLGHPCRKGHQNCDIAVDINGERVAVEITLSDGNIQSQVGRNMANGMRSTLVVENSMRIRQVRKIINAMPDSPEKNSARVVTVDRFL